MPSPEPPDAPAERPASPAAPVAPAPAPGARAADDAADQPAGDAPASDLPPAVDAGPPVAAPGFLRHEVAPEPAEPRADEPPASEPAPPPPPAVPPPVDVHDLDWEAVGRAADPRAARGRLRETVERMETLLDRGDGPGLLFDDGRASPHDRAIRVAALDDATPLWFVGDLHGDLLALEAALALARPDGATGARLVLLGDLFDDGGFGLETLLRVFELILDDPASICVLAGNHDEALGFDGARFTATVSPSDFAEFLDANLAHEWIVRAGKLAVRLFAAAPRALFFPDGLLAAHGGFPLADLHAGLLEHGDWNDPRCLVDFVWARAHPRARRKMPNRTTRGSQFGHEDFAAFCDVATRLGRPVTHMVRGHDHVDDRWEIPPAYAAHHPVLTTNALSRRLAREAFGPYERVPTIARHVAGALPEVHRLHVPPALVRACFPEEGGDAAAAP